ncbi:MAG: fibronectin type III domain-containing protein, partial [bacterium]
MVAKLTYSVLFMVFLFFHTVTAGISRKPYLQLPTQTSMGIAWRTDNNSSGIIQYGIDQVTEKQVFSSISTTRHFKTVENLLPGVRYKYRIISDGDTSEIYTFKPSPLPGGKVRVLLFADTQFFSCNSHTCKEQNKYAFGGDVFDMTYGNYVLPYLKQLNPKPDIILHFGDIVQTGGREV